jgi:hypothetical protein
MPTLAQEMRAFFGGQGEQAADQVALGEITLFLESFQPGLSADAWLLQALSPKSLCRDERGQNALAHGELQLFDAQASGAGDLEECQAALLCQLA